MAYGCTAKCKIKGALNIQNIGNLDSPSSYVKFYLSEDGIEYTGDGFLKQLSTGKIKAGATKIKKLSYSFPAGKSAPGQYVIEVIDADNTVA